MKNKRLLIFFVSLFLISFPLVTFGNTNFKTINSNSKYTVYTNSTKLKKSKLSLCSSISHNHDKKHFKNKLYKFVINKFFKNHSKSTLPIKYHSKNSIHNKIMK